MCRLWRAVPTTGSGAWGDCTKAVASLEPSRPGAITIIVAQYPSVTVLAVRGNGRSIAEDDRPRLLEPCRRAGRQDVPGEGRGFASVRMRIRRHEGAITWQSTLGVGIAFTCTMTHTLPHEISYAWHTTVTMLLVGDDPSMPG